MSNNEKDKSGDIRKEDARLCHVIKTPTFDGYGFNLHAGKDKSGQYIGKVDEGSPAESAGLKQGDRILEVNGVDITTETHQQVVQRIKANPNETKLLVVSVLTDSEENSPKATSDKHVTNESSDNHNHDSPNTNDITMKLSMTAAELRAELAAKKKYDPKKETLDFRKKFDIVQKL